MPSLKDILCCTPIGAPAPKYRCVKAQGGAASAEERETAGLGPRGPKLTSMPSDEVPAETLRAMVTALQTEVQQLRSKLGCAADTPSAYLFNASNPTTSSQQLLSTPSNSLTPKGLSALQEAVRCSTHALGAGSSDIPSPRNPQPNTSSASFSALFSTSLKSQSFRPDAILAHAALPTSLPGMPGPAPLDIMAGADPITLLPAASSLAQQDPAEALTLHTITLQRLVDAAGCLDVPVALLLFKELPEGGDDTSGLHTPQLSIHEKMMSTEPSSFSSTPRAGQSFNGLQSTNPGTYSVRCVWANSAYAVRLAAASNDDVVAHVNQKLTANLAVNRMVEGFKRNLDNGRPTPSSLLSVTHKQTIKAPSELATLWLWPCNAMDDEEGTLSGRPRGLLSAALLSCEPDVSREQHYQVLLREHMACAWSPSMITLLDAEGTIVMQNPESCARMGIHAPLQACTDGWAPELPGKSFNYLQELFGAQHKEMMQEMETMLQAYQPFQARIEILGDVLRGWYGLEEDEHVWFQVTITGMKDPLSGGNLLCVAQVDITDVVASEEHVMQLQQEQAALLREILPEQVIERLLLHKAGLLAPDAHFQQTMAPPAGAAGAGAAGSSHHLQALLPQANVTVDQQAKGSFMLTQATTYSHMQLTATSLGSVPMGSTTEVALTADTTSHVFSTTSVMLGAGDRASNTRPLPAILDQEQEELVKGQDASGGGLQGSCRDSAPGLPPRHLISTQYTDSSSMQASTHPDLMPSTTTVGLTCETPPPRARRHSIANGFAKAGGARKHPQNYVSTNSSTSSKLTSALGPWLAVLKPNSILAQSLRPPMSPTVRMSSHNRMAAMRNSPVNLAASTSRPTSHSNRDSHEGTSHAHTPSRANSFVDMSLLNTAPSSGLPSNVTHAGLMTLAASINGAVHKLTNAIVTASSASPSNAVPGSAVAVPAAGCAAAGACGAVTQQQSGSQSHQQLEQTLRLISGPLDPLSTQALIEEVQPAQPSRIWLTQQDVLALATYHGEVTVLFCDIKGFTSLSNQLHPGQIMLFLNTLYSVWDSLLESFDVYKVETIGDSYVAACGLFSRDPLTGAKRLGGHDPDHAKKMIAFAKAMLWSSQSIKTPLGEPVQCRIGLHTGPCSSGVVGQRMPRFCLFGDTVNTASRMESTGQPGCVQASATTWALLQGEPWRPTGGVMAKGKGLLQTYLLPVLPGSLPQDLASATSPPAPLLTASTTATSLDPLSPTAAQHPYDPTSPNLPMSLAGSSRFGGVHVAFHDGMATEGVPPSSSDPQVSAGQLGMSPLSMWDIREEEVGSSPDGGGGGGSGFPSQHDVVHTFKPEQSDDVEDSSSQGASYVNQEGLDELETATSAPQPVTLPPGPPPQLSPSAAGRRRSVGPVLGPAPAGPRPRTSISAGAHAVASPPSAADLGCGDQPQPSFLFTASVADGRSFPVSESSTAFGMMHQAHCFTSTSTNTNMQATSCSEASCQDQVTPASQLQLTQRIGSLTGVCTLGPGPPSPPQAEHPPRAPGLGTTSTSQVWTASAAGAEQGVTSPHMWQYPRSQQDMMHAHGSSQLALPSSAQNSAMYPLPQLRPVRTSVDTPHQIIRDDGYRTAHKSLDITRPHNTVSYPLNALNAPPASGAWAGSSLYAISDMNDPGYGALHPHAARSVVLTSSPPLTSASSCAALTLPAGTGPNSNNGKPPPSVTGSCTGGETSHGGVASPSGSCQRLVEGVASRVLAELQQSRKAPFASSSSPPPASGAGVGGGQAPSSMRRGSMEVTSGSHSRGRASSAMVSGSHVLGSPGSSSPSPGMVRRKPHQQRATTEMSLVQQGVYPSSSSKSLLDRGDDNGFFDTPVMHRSRGNLMSTDASQLNNSSAAGSLGASDRGGDMAANSGAATP